VAARHVPPSPIRRGERVSEQHGISADPWQNPLPSGDDSVAYGVIISVDLQLVDES
jgi:hypothetical protein